MFRRDGFMIPIEYQPKLKDVIEYEQYANL